MVAESYDIARETYLAILMDRDHLGPVIVGSPEGGMDIEEVARKNPELIYKVSTCISCYFSHIITMKSKWCYYNSYSVDAIFLIITTNSNGSL